jgi:hypothetical protein
MFVRAKDYENYIVKVRIDIGLELGLENEADAFIELKELPTRETMRMKEIYAKGEVALLEYFEEILPVCVLNHNLYETEEKKMSNEEVTKLIFEKSILATKVIGEFIDKVFFIQAKAKGAK